MMDQFTGGGEAGGNAPQTAGAYVPPAYGTEAAAPKRPTGKRWLWIAGGAVILAAAVIVLVLCLAPARAAGNQPDPMLFSEDDEVYLAVGANTIQLEGAALAVGNYLNAMESVDGKTLYYLADVSEKSGEGDLMCIALGNPNAKPERIAEGVYTAKVSADDNKILFISDYEDGAGDLYLCTPGGEPQQLGEAVYGSNYGFSPNGSIIYYTTINGADSYTLMEYAGGKETEIAKIKDASPKGVYADDSGHLLYKEYSSDEEYTLYLYTGGDPERICKDSEYIYAYPIKGSADEFMYSAEGALYYYTRGDEARITDDFDGLRFVETSSDPRVGNGRRFLLTDGKDSDDLTLSEVNLPGDPVKVGKCDGAYLLSETGAFVTFRSNEHLYLVKKAGSDWGEREKICKDPQYASFEGAYLYYLIQAEDETSGELCRVLLSGGEEESLLSDVTQCLVTERGVYAINADGEACYVQNKNRSNAVEDDITALYEANGGVYLAGEDGDLYYYVGGEGERVSRDAKVLQCNGYIDGQFD